MSDLALDRTYKKSDNGPQARLIQEWLCLNNFHVFTDGVFGPATEFALQQFQAKAGLTPNGVVDAGTFAQMIRPMTEALKPIPPTNQTLGQMVVLYAEQHLRQSPREVGGQNKGPWVRLYMQGNEGEQWAWCAGFACFVLNQACESLHVSPPPVERTISCDRLASNAQQRSIFLAGAPGMDATKLSPGSFFLSRRTATDWVHTGIVTRVVDAEKFQTIEGNTNDDGSREGYEVCQRIRAYNGMDFVLIR